MTASWPLVVRRSLEDACGKGRKSCPDIASRRFPAPSRILLCFCAENSTLSSAVHPVHSGTSPAAEPHIACCACCAGQDALRLWDAATGKCLAVFVHHTDPVRRVGRGWQGIGQHWVASMGVWRVLAGGAASQRLSCWVLMFERRAFTCLHDHLQADAGSQIARRTALSPILSAGHLCSLVPGWQEPGDRQPRQAAVSHANRAAHACVLSRTAPWHAPCTSNHMHPPANAAAPPSLPIHPLQLRGGLGGRGEAAVAHPAHPRSAGGQGRTVHPGEAWSLQNHPKRIDALLSMQVAFRRCWWPRAGGTSW